MRDYDAAADRIETPTSSTARPYELVSVGQLLAAQQPVEFIVDGLFERNVSAGIVAPPEAGKSLFAMNIAACVATGQPFHGRNTRRGLVVYLLGEGQQGAGRRFQALEHRYSLGLKGAPLVVSKCRASLIEDSEVERVRSAISQAESDHGEKLTLLVVDTLARFIAPGDDNKAQDMGAYLDAVDLLRGEASSISLHHPGHGDSKRGRGSSSWRGGLDTEYSIANADGVVTITCEKMKDGEKPAPFSFRIEQAPTMTARPDGYAVMSVVLAPTEQAAAPSRARPSGKNQKNLLAELERRAAGDPLGIWTEGQLREIGRDIGMHKNSARNAVLGLRTLGYLVETVGGTRLSHAPDKGPKDPNRDQSTLSVQDTGTKTGDQAHSSIRTVPRSLWTSPSGGA